MAGVLRWDQLKALETKELSDNKMKNFLIKLMENAEFKLQATSKMYSDLQTLEDVDSKTKNSTLFLDIKTCEGKRYGEAAECLKLLGESLIDFNHKKMAGVLPWDQEKTLETTDLIDNKMKNFLMKMMENAEFNLHATSKIYADLQTLEDSDNKTNNSTLLLDIKKCEAGRYAEAAECLKLIEEALIDRKYAFNDTTP